MKLFSGFKAHCLPRSDGHFRAGPWVAPDARLSGPDIEDAETAQLDPVAIGQSLLEALEDRIDSGLGLDAGQTSPFDNVVDDVLFNQCLHPKSRVCFPYAEAGVMLESFLNIVNASGVS
jgi:hypothetical protein